MKKPFFSLLKALPLAVVACACSGDNDDNTTGIKGKWLYTGYSNNTQDTYYPVNDCTIKTFTIKSKGTALLRIIGCGDGYNGVFTWETTPQTDIYNFKTVGFEPEAMRLTLSPNEDSLFVEAAADDSFTDVYKRL